MRKILVALSDWHAGHRLGLLNPACELSEEDENGNWTPFKPNLTAVQEFLWTAYLEDLDNVARLADGAPIVVFHIGDLTQGKAYPSHLVSTRTVDQIEIAVQNMQPLLELPNLQAVRLAAGTGSHGFYGQTAELLTTKRLQEQRAAVDIQAVYHGLANVDGVLVDYAHHGPSAGIRLWTGGNQLRHYLKSLILEDIVNGREPPRLVLRGHFHNYHPERVWVDGTREWVADIVLLPGYCGMGEHGRQATRSKSSFSVGLVAFVVEGGSLVQTRPFRRTPDLRTREDL